MQRSGVQRIIPIAIILIIIALAIAALFSIGRVFFGGSDPIANEGKEALRNTSVGHQVRMTVRGPIVADENFYSYRITISNNQRKLETYRGYLETPLQTREYGNSNKAYEEFVYALDRARYMDSAVLSGDSDDVRGICASGKLYRFDVLNGETIVKRLWTTTCKGQVGSQKVNTNILQPLFAKQIPDATAALRDTKL